MKKMMMMAAMLLLTAGAFAQKPAGDPKGGISADLLKEIAKGYEGTATDKALQNALNAAGIATLSAKAGNLANMDTHFSDMVRTKGRTDQKSSGRCWLFTGLNVMRAKMIDKFDLGAFTFSQNYVFFYDQLEKANLFLQGIIDTKDLPFEDRKVDWLFANPLSDGGQFTGVSNLIMKYGVVPSNAMPETLSSESTSAMAGQISTKLREDGLRLRESGKNAAVLQQMKVDMLKEIYRILVLCLGEPPTEFTWARYNSKGEFVDEKTYTPKSFYQTFVG